MLSFVFPGQGSQSVGMFSDLAREYPVIKETFDQASDLLSYDLWELSQHGPLEALDQTAKTQPALLAAGYAAFRLMTENTPVKPTILAGHSLGEYTALVCAGSLSFDDAIKLVAARGQFMQEAVGSGLGKMAAIIGLDESLVQSICEEIADKTKKVISPANFNSIGQIVIAGESDAIQAAIALAKEKGAKMAVILPVSVPSHCELMRPAALRLSEMLTTIPFNVPHLPVISNVDVKPYSSVTQIRDGLTRQLYLPVRWVETIQSLVKLGITDIIECGPGKVLTGLNKRIDKNIKLLTTVDYLKSFGGITDDTNNLAQ